MTAATATANPVWDADALERLKECAATALTTYSKKNREIRARIKGVEETYGGRKVTDMRKRLQALGPIKAFLASALSKNRASHVPKRIREDIESLAEDVRVCIDATEKKCNELAEEIGPVEEEQTGVLQQMRKIRLVGELGAPEADGRPFVFVAKACGFDCGRIDMAALECALEVHDGYVYVVASKPDGDEVFRVVRVDDAWLESVQTKGLATKFLKDVAGAECKDEWTLVKELPPDAPGVTSALFAVPGFRYVGLVGHTKPCTYHTTERTAQS